jgi:hypothetical protein
MMKMALMAVLLLCGTASFAAKNEHNATKKSQKNITQAELKKQMEREKKYAKEQKFYNADEYDFKGAEVNPKSLEHIPVIEPDYDFDMDEGVYSD